MSDIDLTLEGLQETARAFRELEDEIDDDGVTYVVGSAVEYGVYLEFGTEKMSPRPWFRPAIREFRANPQQFILDNTDFGSIDEIETTEELVRVVAIAAENQLSKNVSAGTATDRSPGTKSESPARDTGTLVNSIQAIRLR